MRACLVVVIMAVFLAAEGRASTGLVAEWLFKEGTGDTILDATGHTPPGRVYGAQWAAREGGHALSFDSKGAHVDCGTSESLDIREAVTLEAWVYPTARAASETGVAGKSFDTYGLTLYSDGNFYWYIGSGGNKCSVPGRVNRWNHVTGTFDGKDLRMFLDGEARDTRPSQFTTVNPGGSFYIGCIARDAADGALTDSFQGYIGAVRVYNRALSEEEVRTLYARDKASFPRMYRDRNTISLGLYPYDTGEIFLDVDFGTLFPWSEEEQAEVSLWRKNPEQKLQSMPIITVPENDVIMDLRFFLTAGNPERMKSGRGFTAPPEQLLKNVRRFPGPLIQPFPCPRSGPRRPCPRFQSRFTTGPKCARAAASGLPCVAPFIAWSLPIRFPGAEKIGLRPGLKLWRTSRRGGWRCKTGTAVFIAFGRAERFICWRGRCPVNSIASW